MAGSSKPNILVLWGDDIGWYNISHNNRGAMGYQTPNIDRIAREGIEFTDFYAQQSCTAGRAAFITGQNPVRTGLTKVGIPGSTVGLSGEDPTIAELLKPLGYATGQFGKNHLGDLDEFLPTNHGFDEFYGNLYHLNAEDEPEHPDYPKDPAFRERFGPRGVIHSYADGRIEDTGPLTKKRMETIDDDVTERAIAFIREAHAAGKPFFVWWNSTHMHVWTRIPEEAEGISGQGFYNDAMVLHDISVGQLLDVLDELGIADDTIVLYSTDNGPHYNTWPDGAISPWRSEKNSNWEGAYRVPSFARWPGQVRGRQGAQRHRHPPGMAAHAAGRRRRAGHRGEAREGAQGRRQDVQGPCRRLQRPAVPAGRDATRAHANGSSTPTTTGWSWPSATGTGRPSSTSSAPRPCSSGPSRSSRCGCPRSSTCAAIRSSGPTRTPTATGTGSSSTSSSSIPMQALAAEQIQSFREFPPRQKPAAFNLDAVMAQMAAAADSGLH